MARTRAEADFYLRCQVDRPFSTALRAFLSGLAQTDWEGVLGGVVFIRDHERLPERATFDLDLLMTEESSGPLEVLLRTRAQAQDLVWLVRRTEAGFLALVVDVEGEADRRSWIYLETINVLKLSGDRSITASDVGRRIEKGLPVPTPDWRFVLGVWHWLSRGKIDKHRRLIESGLAEDSACALLRRVLGVEASDVRRALGDAEARTALARAARIAMPKAKSVASIMPSPGRQVMFRRLYVLDILDPLLITVHGADGVGKSTLCEAVHKRLQRLPLPVDALHHNRGWKYGEVLRSSPENGSEWRGDGDRPIVNRSEEPVGPMRRILRWGYGRAPLGVRALWSALIGVHTYGRGQADFIAERVFRRRIIVMDRYIYDNLAKMRAMGGGSRATRVTLAVASRLMRKPLLALAILDEPERIVARKKELSVGEIAAFQTDIVAIARRCARSARTIAVAGRGPDAVAGEAVRLILQHLGARAVESLRTHQALCKLERPAGPDGDKRPAAVCL